MCIGGKDPKNRVVNIDLHNNITKLTLQLTF